MYNCYILEVKRLGRSEPNNNDSHIATIKELLIPSTIKI